MFKGSKYNPDKIRNCEQVLDTELEVQLIHILIEFADTIDPYGSDDGDYDTTMKQLLEVIKNV